MGLSRREPRGGTIEVGHAVARLVRDFAWEVEFARLLPTHLLDIGISISNQDTM